MLKFAPFACTLQVNQKVSKTAHIKELNQEIDRLKAELFCTREKNGVYMPTDQFQQMEQVSKPNQNATANPTMRISLKSTPRSPLHWQLACPIAA